jgi:hypothetical protein
MLFLGLTASFGSTQCQARRHKRGCIADGTEEEVASGTWIIRDLVSIHATRDVGNVIVGELCRTRFTLQAQTSVSTYVLLGGPRARTLTCHDRYVPNMGGGVKDDHADFEILT